MCATCGSIGKYGQSQPEAIAADKAKLDKVRRQRERAADKMDRKNNAHLN